MSDTEKKEKEDEKEDEIVVTDGVHNYTEEKNYVWTDNKKVQAHLDRFHGLKLGFMVHWAPVSQLGLTSSWPLSDGDRDWARGQINWTKDMEEFKEQYWDLNKTFNPVKLRPDKWAELAKECGFKYLLFTTKHHDGFCMFDTKTTDYKITGSDCPFSKNENADIVKALFNAFRDKGMEISAYFSKPDWHSDAYWHREFKSTPTRNVNYDVKKYPELWEEFVQYTHTQLTELTSNYGKIDALWLDGGWVRPSVDGQDIRLGEIVEKIRATTQPDLICCDRTVGGPYENIVTPEQSIPEAPMDIPWEANMTLGRDFGFIYDDDFKPADVIINALIDVVSKGGNLALNISPRPDGEFPEKAVHILRQLGSWLNVNGEGIYDTRISHYTKPHGLKYTAKDNTEFAFFPYHGAPVLPSTLYTQITSKVKTVTLLRTSQAIPIRYDVVDGREFLVLDTSMVNMVGAEYADCFKMTL